jgi:hypothetical protein
MSGSEVPDKAAVSREAQAMREIADSLRPLEPDERRRVLDWARRFAGAVTRGEPET